MVIKPKFRGFICTTAHPDGCAENVRQSAAYAQKTLGGDGPKRVLVIGASTGYGLASRIAAAFGYGADSVGVFFERPAAGNRTASAGWYNNQAFEKLASQKGLIAKGVNGDAFSAEIKEQTIAAIREVMPGGQVDLVVYSVAAPKRLDPDTGVTWNSALKPIGSSFEGKTMDFHTGVVSDTAIEPAAAEEIEGTARVMGGDDWLLWMNALLEADVLAKNVCTLAYTYIGPSLTHGIYRDGTIGKAKEDLERRAKEITAILSPRGGKAFISVLKALVTQSSAAIPVVPLYISLLFKIMKAKGTHEDCIAQITRMYRDRLYMDGVPSPWDAVPVDDEGRIRMDDWEMEPDIQREISAAWDSVTTETIAQLGDLDGFRKDFFSLFGFCVEGVDYDADVQL